MANKIQFEHLLKHKKEQRKRQHEWHRKQHDFFKSVSLYKQ